MSSLMSGATAALTAFEFAPSLARLNFDFTVVKVEAPPEYHGVGTTISERRKASAENGAVHRTARKLDALFRSILPSTPELYKAYGARVSEIARSSKVNPQPTSRDGIFAGEVGADTTSLWAAATSGQGAIGVHLLACLLARMWSGPEAASIWEEIVIGRKAQIQRKVESAIYPSEYHEETLASIQEFSRAELAAWDASARSWIQSADQAKILQHKQLMLILENLGISVNSHCDLYASVTSAWISALQAMNDLIKGTSLQVQDGSALLGMSSWHLYPDMIVLKGAGPRVPQNDTLFQPSATLTVGLQFADESRRSVSWSLSLAHLKYYGHPVQSSRSIGLENSRVTIDHFAYIVLGCVFGGWKEYASTPEIGLSWVLKIAELLEKFPKRLEDSSDGLTPSATKDAFITDFYNITKHKSWIGWLFSAAQRLNDSKGIERELGLKQLGLGRRRYQALSPGISCPAPVFGLSKPSVLLSIIIDQDSRIKFLRDFAKAIELSNSTHIIRYKQTSDVALCPYEYASILPIDNGGKKAHARWLPINAYYIPNRGVLHCACNPRCHEDCPCRLRNTECSVVCHNRAVGVGTSCGNDDYLRCLEIRHFEILASGEHCFLLLEMAPYQYTIQLENLLVKMDFSESFESGLRYLSDQDSAGLLKALIGLKLIAGDQTSAALLAFNLGKNVITPGKFESLVSDVPCGHLPPEILGNALLPDMLNLNSLVHWLNCFKLPGQRDQQKEDSTNDAAAAAEADGYKSYTTSLRVCVAASEVYKLLPDSTISTMVVEQSLWKSKWMPKQPEGSSHLISDIHLMRPQVLACIAMFDSGTCNLDPDGLREAFAISSGNSIFVVAPLLCDPFEEPHPTEVRRVIGNVGRPGITILVPPAEPKTRSVCGESWTLINHRPFDGKLEDCFQHTTIHLGFTKYEMPLSDGQRGQHLIDRPAVLVETVVSVHDRGIWIADLDVLGALEQKRGENSALQSSTCTCVGNQKLPSKRKYSSTFKEVFGDSKVPLISLDNWEEFLDAPSDGVLVVRAHQNWLARLAFTVMSVSRGRRTLVLPADVCWSCCKASLEKTQRKDAGNSILIC